MRAVLGLGRVLRGAPVRPGCPRQGRACRPSARRGRRGATASQDEPRVAEPAAAAEAAHVAGQATYFARVLPLMQSSVTPEVHQRLQAVADAVPGLAAGSRVLDAGCGDGVLIPHLQARGVQDILAVDVTPEMIAELERRVGTASTLGNEPGVRTWVGDILDVPAYQGPFDAIFYNAVFGNLLDEHAGLTKACFLLRPGGHIVISHPLGRAWHEEYRLQHQDIVPNPLPTEEQLLGLIHDLPLRLLRFVDSGDLYMALLQVPEGYAHPRAPIHLSGAVTTGFGRGSRQLGVPTANLPPEPLAEELADLPAGVYFGWARLEAGAGAPAADSETHKMVMNIGKRPTFGDEEPSTSVELHIMHKYAEDFYGKQLRAVALGYIRPELKFASLDDLLGRINTDVGIARSQLDLPQWQACRGDAFLQQQ